ncbi:MAG TPA: protein kinase [Gemmatimonadaceae bacterium]|nr:protein kinase [Gemmatimonadaceae bacterium]
MGEARDPRQQLLEDTLGGQYEVLRMLGQGGAGTVYLARERLLERLVAIKVLRPELVTPESRERFVREARTAAKLMHANIVPLYAFGQAGDTLFYIMGFVEGDSLESLLSGAERMDPVEARRILVEVADALGYAHRNQVVHRDVKPDNIMIERGSRRALLTDFGIAKIASTHATLTQTGHIVGTPLYMSPEQAAGDTTIDGRSDIYSLGVIGYRMLTGRLPIEGTTPQDVMRRHVMQDPPPLQEVAPDAPQDMAWSVTRCLDKDPMRRWPSAEAFRQALEAGDETASDLPEGLEHLGGRGVWAGAAAWLVVMTGSLVAGRGWWVMGMTAVAAALVLAALLGTAYKEATGFGLERARVWRLLFAPPEWWKGSWPASLRRSGDVFERLPDSVRRSRKTHTTALVTALLVAPAVLGFGISSRQPWVAGAVALGVGLLLWAMVATADANARRSLAAAGVAPHAIRKWLSEPTWSSKFWRRSEVAALLRATRSRVAQRTIDSAGEESYCVITPTQFELPHGMFDHIDPRSPTPLYAQIASRLRVAIASGELRSGEGLPSVRQLAGQLRVNPATVVQAYRELETEGLVSTKQGAGTFVQEVAADRRNRERQQEARRLVRDLVAQAATFGITSAELRTAMEQELKSGNGARR